MAASRGCGYVVASWQLADELRKHRERLNDEYQPVDSNQNTVMFQGATTEDCWLALLAERMTIYIPTSNRLSNRRWLYRVLHRESVMADAEMADAALLSCDVWMDSMTNIITFPAHTKIARLMVREEAETLGLDLAHAEIEDFTREFIALRDTVVYKYGVTTKHIAQVKKRKENYRKHVALKLAA